MNSNNLVGMNVIVAMVMIELIIENAHLTGNMTWNIAVKSWTWKVTFCWKWLWF